MFDTNPKVEEFCTQVYEANHPGLLNDSDGVDECFVAMPEVRPFPSALYFCSEVQAASTKRRYPLSIRLWVGDDT